ncbi:chemotaxis protein CheB [Flavobacterium sp. Fl-77]|uniref:protein-glutamate methylesterase n=1 Tax=Flavobacterium flavipigmentatum TaxID=2893884 RepID=A0AAJ2SKA6_9FLAO|nr:MULTISPECIES: chemotaxis protein CheB [unclassified Flavobacterium]MDX6183911.1 chemotaxis protein CheB [Flavobacterium sp. Fl-33]MDX6187523.1 chemotaxis protein CheB [Flavobacterium sp. Fl-77]UFH37639.1 chemotaxis protein CheB [Flavobacterium sp. F-70]
MEESKVKKCKVVIIGGSAGSLQALLQILPQLPPVRSFAIVIVLHRKSTDDTALENLIKLKSKIPVFSVEDKVPLRAGFLYIAPSNYHLLFEKNGILALDTSEKINYSRPSIDVSFESASEVYQTDLVGILLSGSNTDGTAGIKAIQKAGGTIVIQDPKSAEMPFMPNNAIANTTPDYVLNVQQLLDFIILLDK